MYSHVSNDYERLTFHDYILFIIIFICPYLDNGVWYNVTHFIPLINSLGCQFLAFILSLYLWQYSARHQYSTIPRSLYIMVLTACIWTFIKLFQTISITGIREAMTVYRRNYILLPSFFLCMSYISNLSIIRMKLLFELALKWILFTCVLYFMQCIGLPIFTSDIHTQTVGGISVIRNILGLPTTTPVFISFFFISYLFEKSTKMLVYTFICIGVVIISYTRNLMAVMGMVIILSVIIHVLKYGFHDRTFKIIFYICLTGGIAMIIIPNVYSFWSNLIENTINVQMTKEQGTYAFRQRLIEKAITENKMKDTFITGLGYIRDSAKGNYSYVLGTDTFIAPILRCEGVIGLILRCLPCVYLLWKNLILLTRQNLNNNIAKLSMVIVVSILSVIPNYIQTEIFVRYNYILAPLYIMYIYILKKK